jgi:hypothetical protein
LTTEIKRINLFGEAVYFKAASVHACIVIVENSEWVLYRGHEMETVYDRQLVRRQSTVEAHKRSCLAEYANCRAGDVNVSDETCSVKNMKYEELEMIRQCN